MLRKILLFAVTSGLAARAYKAYARHRAGPAAMPAGDLTPTAQARNS